MIISMTGYGRTLKENRDCHVTVEMRAVNHRFCEINIRMPRQFFFLEDKLKKIILKQVKRGKVDVFINLKGEGIVNRSLQVDWDLLDEYHQAFEEIGSKYVTSQTFPIDKLLLHEDVVEVQESDSVAESLETMVIEGTIEATSQLKEMRKREGIMLYEDIHKRINKMDEGTQKLKDYAPQVQAHYRERLMKRVQEFMSGNLDIDESRILTEVAVYADKADIQEELTRIESHLKQFSQVLNQSEVVGRKLDFLVQELNREINTIGSKANDVSISQTVVDLKSELEKIREQVQNIE
ncbi:YicC/YloC family endoribonuclease [Evansella cellulosilytica]|uniref:YicC family protein n=1 Tax=Evansella cellulosilytica (strain ATCC 21833 / DSM 2522 / FERM P-1141 / JCM 9156 / N-4) TaxID=649639 RepID=E6TTP7_EVAC2|nr:YicC/YloC family endoribonuclease [Evansella cellulosilytica]ADU30816.1 domain of unknown function DUF1732 [Evansella cellulosilytica DSM 2522]